MKWFLLILGGILMLNLVSADTPVSSCGTLSSANTRYYLTGNLTTTGTTCLTIGANNITLDGQGYWLNAGASGTDIRSLSRTDITIKNIHSKGTNYNRVFFAGHSNNNLLIENSIVINHTGQGIYLYYSGTSGNTNLIIRNITFYPMLNSVYPIQSSFYQTNVTFENINIIGTSNAGTNSIYTQWYNNNITLKNINITCGGITTEGTSLSNYFNIYNLFINNTGCNSQTGFTFYGANTKLYLENGTFINATSATNPSVWAGSIIFFSSAIKDTYFKNILINGSNYYGINFYYGSLTQNVTNVTFENIVIANTRNESINIDANSANRNFSVNFINATYTNERVVKGSGLKSELIKKWKYEGNLNSTCGVVPNKSIWAVNQLVGSELIEDSFDDIDYWTTTGDSQLEYSYFYVYDLDSYGEAPHIGGTLTTAIPLNPQIGDKYTIKLVDVDTSSGGVPLNVSMCGNSYGFNKGFYGSDERTITCSNTDQFMISVPADNVGEWGYYYTGITDYISIRKWSDVLEDNKTTDNNGNATLLLTEYVNLNGVKTYRDNYTIYGYNTTYFDNQNMTSNKQKTFNILDCLIEPNCWTKFDWGLFIPRGCVYQLNKGQTLFL
jgi:hypothetical protein